MYFNHKDWLFNLRKGFILILSKINSLYYGRNTVHVRETLIRNNLPAVVKFSQSIDEFKRKIRNHRNVDCRCLISKIINCFVVVQSMLLHFIYLFSWILHNLVGFYQPRLFLVPTANKDLIIITRSSRITSACFLWSKS